MTRNQVLVVPSFCFCNEYDIDQSGVGFHLQATLVRGESIKRMQASVGSPVWPWFDDLCSSLRAVTPLPQTAKN